MSDGGRRPACRQQKNDPCANDFAMRNSKPTRLPLQGFPLGVRELELDARFLPPPKWGERTLARR
jgi:hypothetical protein